MNENLHMHGYQVCLECLRIQLRRWVQFRSNLVTVKKNLHMSDDSMTAGSQTGLYLRSAPYFPSGWSATSESRQQHRCSLRQDQGSGPRSPGKQRVLLGAIQCRLCFSTFVRPSPVVKWSERWCLSVWCDAVWNTWRCVGIWCFSPLQEVPGHRPGLAGKRERIHLLFIYRNTDQQHCPAHTSSLLVCLYSSTTRPMFFTRPDPHSQLKENKSLTWTASIRRLTIMESISMTCHDRKGWTNLWDIVRFSNQVIQNFREPS